MGRNAFAITSTNDAKARAADLAEGARLAANQIAELLRTKAGPSAKAAFEWVSPRAELAWRKGITAAAPKVTEAAAFLSPKVDEARDVIVERALPAIVAAVDQAARVAASAAGQPEPKKRHRLRKVLLWGGLASVLGAIGYWFWRQTQPVTDPWAEEDWDTLEQAPEENLADAAGDAADAVGEAAGTAVKKVTDAAKKAADATKKATAKLTDHSKEAAEETLED